MDRILHHFPAVSFYDSPHTLFSIGSERLKTRFVPMPELLHRSSSPCMCRWCKILSIHRWDCIGSQAVAGLRCHVIPAWVSAWYWYTVPIAT